MVEDLKIFFIASWAKEVEAKTGTPANHLPEFGNGFDRFGKDEVDDVGDIYPGVEHVNGYCDGEVFGTVPALEVVDELLGTGFVAVDAQAEVSTVLGEFLVEYFNELFGVLVVAGEYDGLAHAGTVGVANAVFHEVTQDYAVSFWQIYALGDLAVLVINGFGVFSLGFELELLFSS